MWAGNMYVLHKTLLVVCTLTMLLQEMAFEQDQKYKVGKVILEVGVLAKDGSWDTADQQDHES